MTHLSCVCVCPGTVYLQVTEPLLIVSGFCVYSVASALFMFPALYLYYEPALRVCVGCVCVGGGGGGGGMRV